LSTDTKWEATACIIAIINKAETFTEQKVKTLCSNNGGEFANNKLTAYLEQKGVILERALPYHHHQNGMIKRFNRTVPNMAQTILLDSSLPKSFWSYAFAWVAHTLNRIPNKASSKITPLEDFLRHKPQYSIFRVFGSVGYAHVPVELRKKLNNRPQHGHVVEYLGPSKGWCLWIPEEDCFIDLAMVCFPDELKDVPTLPSKPKHQEHTKADATPAATPLLSDTPTPAQQSRHLSSTPCLML
jgi:hypothetical protein